MTDGVARTSTLREDTLEPATRAPAITRNVDWEVFDLTHRSHGEHWGNADALLMSRRTELPTQESDRLDGVESGRADAAQHRLAQGCCSAAAIYPEESDRSAIDLHRLQATGSQGQDAQDSGVVMNDARLPILR